MARSLITLTLLVLLLSGCGSLMDQIYRSQNIRDRFAMLEPGMTKGQVHSIMGYRPDRYKREITRHNTLEETEVYTANYVIDSIEDPTIPLLYILVYKNETLIMLDVRDNVELRYINRMEKWYQNSKEKEQVKKGDH